MLRLEAEFALRERVHYVVFGILSNAQDVLDLEERLKISRDVPSYVQGILNAAQRILSDRGDEDTTTQVRKYIERLIDNAVSTVEDSSDDQTRRAAKEIVSNVVTQAKEEMQRRASLRDTAREIVANAINSASQKALSYGIHVGSKEKDGMASAAEDISENLSECAKDIVAVAIVSSLHRRKDDREVVAARCLAIEAVQAAKASLERLYGVKFEVIERKQMENQETSESLDKCAKDVAAAAIISATRSLERAITEDNRHRIAARSLAVNAVAAAKASLEKLHGVVVEIEDEEAYSPIVTSKCLVKSAKDIAEAIVSSSARLLETSTVKDKLINRTAQSLASDATKEAMASLENLLGMKIDSEEKSEKNVKQIAAAAIISAAGAIEKDLPRPEVDLTVAARGLASSAIDSAKTSMDWLYTSNVVAETNLDAQKMLEEAAKHIAQVAVDQATQSLERVAMKSEWNLASTTQELINNVLASAKASLERLYRIEIEPEEQLTSSQETFIISSSTDSLESSLSLKVQEKEIKVAAQNLSSNAVKSVSSSLKRLHSIVNEMEANIKGTALEISKSLVNSSRNLLQQLEEDGLGIAARGLACNAIEAAAKSISKLYDDEMSRQNIVGSDSRLLHAAAKVSTISARTSLGQLFDRGFIGGAELEEATGYLATHALISAETMLDEVQKRSSTVDLDLEICKAAKELASQAIMSAEDSVARLVLSHQPSRNELSSDHGTLFWKVATFVERLVNGALRRLGTTGFSDDVSDDPEQYEVITHDQARIADEEYSPNEEDLYKREILALKASRIVNDLLENAMDVVKVRRANTAFHSTSDARPYNAKFTRRRSSSVHFSEGSIYHSRRASYVPCETDFLSAVNRPPTPRFRKSRAGSVVSQEIQEVEKELVIPSDGELSATNVFIPRRCSDPGPDISPDHASYSSPGRSASDSKIKVEDSSSLIEKRSLYDIIKKREETASCGISPSGSYVVLPHLNPSECSLIAARVESYESLCNQKKTTSSVTSLPSLSPKGSFIASTAVEENCQGKEPQNRSVASSSRLPEISCSKSKNTKGSKSASSLKQLAEHPRRTSSLQWKKTCPKLTLRTSKESAKLPSKSSTEKRFHVPVGKVTASSHSSLHAREQPRQRSSKSISVASPKNSVKDVRLSQNASGAKKILSPESSLTRTSLPSKPSPACSILFGRPSTEKAVTTLATSEDKTVTSSQSSLNTIALTSRVSTERANVSSRASKVKVTPSPRVSREKVVLSTKVSIEKVTQSSRDSTERATLSSRASKGKLAPSQRTSTQNVALSPSVSKGKVWQSPRASTENAALSPHVSKGNVTQSPRGSTEKAALSPSASKGNVRQSANVSKRNVTKSSRASTENVALSPSVHKENVTQSPLVSSENGISKAKLTQSPHSSTDNAALCPGASKGKLRQSPRVSIEKIAVSSHSSKEKASVSSGASAEKSPASSSHSAAENMSLEKSTLNGNKTSTRSVAMEKTLSSEDAAVILQKALKIEDKTVPIQSANTLGSKESVTKTTELSEKTQRESSRAEETVESSLASSTSKLEKTVDHTQTSSQVEEVAEKSFALTQGAPLGSSASQTQGVGAELDHSGVEKSETGGASNEPKEVEKKMNLANPSLERIIHDKRLTPEGAEAESRPASSADVLAVRKCTGPRSLQNIIPFQSDTSENVKVGENLETSLSKSLSSADVKPGGKTTEQVSSGTSQEMTVSKTSYGDEFVAPRTKPEGADRSEAQNLPFVVGSVSSEKRGEKKELVRKVSDASTHQIKEVLDTKQQPVKRDRYVDKVESHPAYRKVSISRSVHDVVDDIVQKMLSTADEPSTVEASPSLSRGSHQEMKQGSETNFNALRRFGRERRLPASKVSKTVVETVDFMLQTVSSSDVRKPRHSSGRRFSGSDVQAGYGE